MCECWFWRFSECENMKYLEVVEMSANCLRNEFSKRQKYEIPQSCRNASRFFEKRILVKDKPPPCGSPLSHLSMPLKLFCHRVHLCKYLNVDI